jgi:hypothetical protein
MRPSLMTVQTRSARPYAASIPATIRVAFARQCFLIYRFARTEVDFADGM